ncbi:MAG: terminase small subunit [Desulfotomaculaceae bacterium]|nr:terminase small subunit [Desulfotomaculaceae bacterium]
MAERGLTVKQQMFVKEYLVDLNATQAAIRAGYSEKTAAEIGCEYLRKPKIQEAVQAAMGKRSKKTEITAEKVLEQLARIAFADIGEFVEINGNTVIIKPFEQVDGTVLSEVAETQNGLKVKLNDKMKALELIGRHLGMFNDKLNVNMNNANQKPGDTVNSLRELKQSGREQGKDQPDEPGAKNNSLDQADTEPSSQ